MLLTTILQAGLSLGVFGKAIAAALAAFAAAFGIGKIGKAAIEAGARQPEYAGHYRMTAIIGWSNGTLRTGSTTAIPPSGRSRPSLPACGGRATPTIRTGS